MNEHLTQRAQRLLDEFDEATIDGEGHSTRHGLGAVLRHLAYTETDGDYSARGIPASRLLALAEELEVPTVLELALAGDREAARSFLFENGFTDKDGRLLPHFREVDD